MSNQPDIYATLKNLEHAVHLRNTASPSHFDLANLIQVLSLYLSSQSFYQGTK
jgi:hypothetical protein